MSKHNFTRDKLNVLRICYNNNLSFRKIGNCVSVLIWTTCDIDTNIHTLLVEKFRNSKLTFSNHYIHTHNISVYTYNGSRPSRSLWPRHCTFYSILCRKYICVDLIPIFSIEINVRHITMISISYKHKCLAWPFF